MFAFLQNLVHYRPPSPGGSPCPSLQGFSHPSGPQGYSNNINQSSDQEAANEYMKQSATAAQLCQIKEENSHNSG